MFNCEERGGLPFDFRSWRTCMTFILLSTAKHDLEIGGMGLILRTIDCFVSGITGFVENI